MWAHVLHTTFCNHFTTETWEATMMPARQATAEWAHLSLPLAPIRFGCAFGRRTHRHTVPPPASATPLAWRAPVGAIPKATRSPRQLADASRTATVARSPPILESTHCFPQKWPRDFSSWRMPSANQTVFTQGIPVNYLDRRRRDMLKLSRSLLLGICGWN